jgi:tetratricopeptide (TPR) repeat protein
MRTSVFPRFAMLAAFSIAAACLLNAQSGQLGQIDFRTSGAPAAQQEFIRGALLLHSFEYEDAAEAFQRAEKLDPNFAMAYWGEAMTQNHPLWAQVNVEAARAALVRLAPAADARQAMASTEREKMYLRAVEALYGDGDKAARDLAYAAAMRELHERFPQDDDASCFYALALLGTTEGVRDTRAYMRAAALLEEVFARNPGHPGAIHYLIHCYDDPAHAPLGLRAARVYAKIAPAASHAQHMISHIYIALGDWDAVVTSNENAVRVSEERLQRRRGPLYNRSHHALHWLEYAYLQQGHFHDGRAKLETMFADARASSAGGNAGYYAIMRATYIVAAPDAKNAPPSLGSSGMSAATDSFAGGWLAIQAGDLDGVRKALTEIQTHRGSSSGATGYAARDSIVAGILADELEALLLVKQSRGEDAVALLKKSAAAEDGLSFEFGPPEIVKPSHELLGEVLLELHRPAEARKQFELALERTPRRSLSLLGEARAASQAGDTAGSQRLYAELREIWQHADAGFAGLQEANHNLAGPADAKPASRPMK